MQLYTESLIETLKIDNCFTRVRYWLTCISPPPPDTYLHADFLAHVSQCFQIFKAMGTLTLNMREEQVKTQHARPHKN